MKASFFPVSAKKLISELKKIKTKIQVVIVNGKDKKQKAKIDKLIKKAGLIHTMHNIGFTDKMVEYLKCTDLVLGKAGGLSTTECINAGVPSLILNHLPQQEIYNKNYLIDNNCAIAVTSSTIAKTINNVLDNPKQLDILKKSTQKVAIHGALNKMYDIISKCSTPDYSDLKVVDSKRQLIKNIDRQRKLDIKTQK